MSSPARLALFASGSGSNAEAIIRYFQPRPSARVVLLLSNNPASQALARAEKYGVPVHVFTRDEFNSGSVLNVLNASGATHVVLAGFLWLLPEPLVRAFSGRIINIHPSLLPKFSGKGMYGAKVHEAVRTAGETETGITIHAVNERYDEGEIIFQASCAISASDTAEAIAQKVQFLEHLHFPEQIEKWIER